MDPKRREGDPETQESDTREPDESMAPDQSRREQDKADDLRHGWMARRKDPKEVAHDDVPPGKRLSI